MCGSHSFARVTTTDYTMQLELSRGTSFQCARNAGASRAISRPHVSRSRSSALLLRSSLKSEVIAVTGGTYSSAEVGSLLLSCSACGGLAPQQGRAACPLTLTNGLSSSSPSPKGCLACRPTSSPSSSSPASGGAGCPGQHSPRPGLRQGAGQVGPHRGAAGTAGCSCDPIRGVGGI